MKLSKIKKHKKVKEHQDNNNIMIKEEKEGTGVGSTVSTPDPCHLGYPKALGPEKYIDNATNRQTCLVRVSVHLFAALACWVGAGV